MKTIDILTADQVNWKDYRNLRLEALKYEPQAYDSSYEEQREYPDDEWKNRLNKYREGKNNWMVFASHEGKLIGMVGAFQRDEDITNNRAEVIAVYINKEFRHQGIGKRLMIFLTNELKNHLIKKVILCVNTEQVSAVNLYKSVGFVLIHEEKRLRGDGKYHTEYDMEKELS